ncbi:MAG: hypothetical protein J0M12_13495, partial [Deltaproteobacteria bacterium]|nr:hypothetical protein [Deltaproteobacteria bacterium]
SKEMDATSLRSSLLFNGKPLSEKEELMKVTGKTLELKLHAQPGINLIEISKDARAADGTTLPANFKARFRTAAPGDIATDRSANFDPKLINDGALQTIDPHVTLRHKAAGAKFLRVLNVGAPYWGAWQPYTETSEWQLPLEGGLKEISVQYWIDGSSAYFVNSSIDLNLDDGIGPRDFQN